MASTLVLTIGCSVPPPDELAYDGPPDVVARIAPDRLPSIAAHAQAPGRTVHTSGSAARGLELNGFADILDAPSFLAVYGTCDAGVEGGCAEQMLVFTVQGESEPVGLDCQPLKARLSVPTLLVRGEIRLYTGRQGVRVLEVWTGTLQQVIVPTTLWPWCRGSGPWALPGPHRLFPHPSRRSRRGSRRPANNRAHQEGAETTSPPGLRRLNRRGHEEGKWT